MSREAFLRFRETVMQDDQLRAELVHSVKSQADLLAMGKRLGFEFSAADLPSRELSDEELKDVAGGVGLAGEHWAPVGSWSPVRSFDEAVRKIL